MEYCHNLAIIGERAGGVTRLNENHHKMAYCHDLVVIGARAGDARRREDRLKTA